MPYCVNNTKANCAEIVVRPNMINMTQAGESIFFPPGMKIISDDQYECIIGNGSDNLTNPQRFFNEQVEIGNFVVTKIESTAITENQVDIVLGMNAKDAIQHIIDVLDRNLLKDIIQQEARSTVITAAKRQLKVVNPQGK